MLFACVYHMPSKDELLKLLGERIMQLRHEKDMSRSDLARACNKDPQSVERVEKGQTNPTYYYLWELAQGLDISLHQLLEFDPEEMGDSDLEK